MLQATSSLLGVMLGPTLGLFSLGMLVPWANAKVGRKLTLWNLFPAAK